MSNSNRTEEEKKTSNGTNEAGGGYWYFAEPKYASYRIIDLDDEMIYYLLRLKEQQERQKPATASIMYGIMHNTCCNLQEKSQLPNRLSILLTQKAMWKFILLTSGKTAHTSLPVQCSIHQV